ncbi:MAG: hypothetical protein ACLR0P_07870 [Oscillospiraceae bacterium]|jgi:hypothetical protein
MKYIFRNIMGLLAFSFFFAGLKKRQAETARKSEERQRTEGGWGRISFQKEHLKGRIQKIHRKSSFSPEGSLQNQYITYRGGGKGVMGQYRR